MAKKIIKKFDKELVANIISDIERYDAAVTRNIQLSEPNNLMVKQFQGFRDEMIEHLLEYLVEIGSLNTIINFSDKKRSNLNEKSLAA